MTALCGLLNLNKAAGMTSRDVVNRVQKQLGRMKLGHAGTLDPLATGVLVVCVGPATRLITYVQAMPKRYRATFELGRESDTEDIEGTVVPTEYDSVPGQEALLGLLPEFQGTILQRPPAYSALKVNGQRSYALARQGQEVVHKARPVTIHSLQVLRYAFPTLELDVCCSSGTYIRSLGRDLGARLGTGAVMTALQRTEIGPFRVEDALSCEDLDRERLLPGLVDPQQAVATFPQVPLQADERTRVRNGLPLVRRGHGFRGEVALVDEWNQLIGIARVKSQDELHPNLILNRGE